LSYPTYWLRNLIFGKYLTQTLPHYTAPTLIHHLVSFQLKWMIGIERFMFKEKVSSVTLRFQSPENTYLSNLQIKTGVLAMLVA
jgi:hypothetical protein